MSTKDEFEVKLEFEDSNFYCQDYKDDEQSETSQFNETGVLTTIKTTSGDNISVYLRLGNRILFCSGKYFYIDHSTAQTDYQKEYTGIVSTCHTCGVKIKGSLKVSSNFLCHLKNRHPEVYQEFLNQKQEIGAGTRLKKADRSFNNNRTSPYPNNSQTGSNILLQQENREQFQRNILNFLIATNQSLNLVQDEHFLKLFEFMDFPVQLKTPCQCEQIIKDDCKYKQLELANFFSHSKVCVCLTSDAWALGESLYLALSCHWIDEQYQRQSCLLACIRSSTLEGKWLQNLQNDVFLRYGFQKDYIVNIVTGNIQNYITDFKEFGIHKEVLCMDSGDKTEDCTLQKQIQENMKLLNINQETEENVVELDVLKLNKIWGIGFLKNLDDKTKVIHHACIEKCFLIWKIVYTKKFHDSFETMLNECLTPPNLFSFTSLYNSLKQLSLNKHLLPQICSFLEKPAFSVIELEYLEEIVEIFEPLHAAFEFLDIPQNHFFGCFLPTLVTLKWKLTRLHSSKKLKHLHDVLNKLKHQLLSEFKLYYELNDTKAEAVLAAITYPPVKTRFLMGLQDTVLSFNFQARNLLLKHGKDYHIYDNQNEANVSTFNQQNNLENLTTARDFFDFGDGTENLADDTQIPNSLKLEVDGYLADGDNSLNSLQKYPTIKRMFYRYNTCIPSPSSVVRLFPLHKILRTSLLNSSTHEQFENYIFYQKHFLNK